MKVSTKVRYGIQALKFIVEESKKGKLVRIKDISEAQNISVQYLEQILFKLKNEGIIEGKRGPTGGYKLIKEPTTITLHDLYKVLDEDEKVIDCNVHGNSGSECGCGTGSGTTSQCSDDSADDECNCNCIWGQLDETMKKIFQGITLDDLVKNNKIIE